MIRGFTHGRRPSIWVDGRVRKTSGPDIVGTAHLPKEWQGVLLAGGYINNAVWSLKINEAGAGFSLTDLAPLVRSTHTSFRPVDVKIGPDGAIYLCDWYNPIIGHYQASFRHPDRDKAHGRIWRITYKGRPLVKPPQIAGAPVEALLENLKSGERYVREQSKRELAGRPTGEVVERLRTWWRALKTDDATTEAGLFEALGVFEAHETPEPDLLDRVLKSTIPHARAYAVGTVARWQDRLKRDPLEIITRLSRDEHPRVQLAAIVAAGNIPRQDSVQVILGAPDFGDDEFLRLAARTAAKVLEPHWKPWAAAGDPHWKPEWSERLALLQAEPAPKKPVEAKPAVALKDEPAAGKLRATADYVAALVAEVRADGDARAGAEVYQRSGCIACHAIDGKGGTIGPALDAIGSGQPLDFIIGATLEPQREIKESFEAVEVTAKDGRVLMGYIVGRDAQHLTVREPATETETRLPVAEIAGQRSIGSFMPAGLVDNLSRAELRDLFRYLADLGKPTLPGK
jgi:putative heme-binding domain-containing protein